MAGYKGSTFDNDVLKLIFNATPIANVADNAATSALANLFISLHTADPTAGGTQTSNECTYTGYARATVARTSGGFTVTGNSVVLTAVANFGACTAGSNTATFGAIGAAVSGASKILYAGPLTPNLSISAGITPQLAVGTTITES